MQVHGFVHDNQTGEKVAMLVGKWDEAMYYVLGDPTTKPKGYDPMTEAVLLWERDKSVTKTRYNLTPFAISLNELTPGLMEKLPPTDSRLRPDQRHLENGEYEMANTEKLRLEQLQRQVFLNLFSGKAYCGSLCFFTTSYEAKSDREDNQANEPGYNSCLPSSIKPSCGEPTGSNIILFSGC